MLQSDFDKEILWNNDHPYILFLKEKINRLIDHSKDLEKKRDDWRSDYWSNSRKVDELYTEINELNSKIRCLENSERDLKSTINNLRDDKKKLQTTLDFNKSYNEKLPKEIKEIKNQIISDSFKIEPFNQEEMFNLINLITKEENYEEKLFQEVKNIVYENAKKNKSVKHLNIILAGPSGVGKSTLINSVLNYANEDCIQTGIGIPCTMGEPKYYESEKVPLLRLADSRGIEKGEYKMEDLNKSIETFIKSQLDSENPDYFVHCIWYCITGTRLEHSEIDTLKELSRIYKSNSIPIIVVYTRALSTPTIKEMEKFIKESFTHDFVPVLAIKETILDNINIDPYGIDNLKNISVLRAKEAVKSSCYEFNVMKTKREVQEIINKKKENLRLILNNIIKEKIEVMSEGKTIEEVYDDLKNLLFYLISNHIYIEDRRYISLESENLIKDFSKKCIDESIPKFKSLFNSYIDIKSSDLGYTLYSYQNNYYNSSYIEYKKSSEQFKNEVKNKLYEETYNKALIYYFKNLIKFICSFCVEKFQENSENIYKQIFEKEEFQNVIVKLIEKDFEEIKTNLVL